VYDALNVLLAIHIIYKDGKAIRWTGMPATMQEQCRKLEVRQPILSLLVATYAVLEDGTVSRASHLQRIQRGNT